MNYLRILKQIPDECSQEQGVGSVHHLVMHASFRERVAHSPRAKKSEFLVNLDRFSKYLRKFEKRSKLTKNSDFFARGKSATLTHHFETFLD